MRVRLFKWSVIPIVVVTAIVTVRTFQQSSPWIHIEGHGLRRADEHFRSILFISPDTGFLGGSHSGATRKSLPEYDAVVYKTVDGGGSWARNELANGEVTQIEFIDDVLYLLVQAHTENNLRNLRSAIFRSTDQGSQWKQVYSTELPYYVRKIFPHNKSTIYALFAEQSNRYSKHYMARSDDAGSSWEEIGPLENIRHYGYIFLKDERIVFMEKTGTVEAYNLLVGKSSTIYDVKDIANPIMTVDSRNNIWLLGHDNGGMQLLMIDADNEGRAISLGNKLGEGSPYSFHVEGDAISVFVTTGASILGTSKDFYRSEDGGNTWRKERIPFSLIAKPACYYGTDYVWALAGGGDLQIRRPEEQGNAPHNE